MTQPSLDLRMPFHDQASLHSRGPRARTVLQLSSRLFLIAGVLLLPMLRSSAGEDPTATKPPRKKADSARPKSPEARQKKSIEKKTKIHRLDSAKRTPYDAFIYVNRIQASAEDGEAPEDFAGRVFGRLANQEGRILLKTPPGMNRESYLGFKIFMRYEGKSSVGNCVACHAPSGFTDLKSHVAAQGGSRLPTPSLRNPGKKKVDVRKAILRKIDASRRKRSGKADEIDAAYARINLNEKDV
ncbi:MAG: hypothetical protein N2C14_21170, partial [Planctomycetales bacterium]